MFIQANTAYNCLTQEGMQAGGAVLDYAMEKGVPGQNNSDGPQLANNPAEMFEKVQVPLPPGQLFMYATMNSNQNVVKILLLVVQLVYA